MVKTLKRKIKDLKEAKEAKATRFIPPAMPKNVLVQSDDEACSEVHTATTPKKVHRITRILIHTAYKCRLKLKRGAAHQDWYTHTPCPGPPVYSSSLTQQHYHTPQKKADSKSSASSSSSYGNKSEIKYEDSITSKDNSDEDDQ